jgi:hypothetical protein
MQQGILFRLSPCGPQQMHPLPKNPTVTVRKIHRVFLGKNSLSVSVCGAIGPYLLINAKGTRNKKLPSIVAMTMIVAWVTDIQGERTAKELKAFKAGRLSGLKY